MLSTLHRVHLTVANNASTPDRRPRDRTRSLLCETSKNWTYLSLEQADAMRNSPMTPQLLHGPPGFGRGVLFCLLVGVALAEVSMPWCALLRCPPDDNVRAISSASSSVTGLTASPVSLFTRARQYKLRCANCSESSEALLVLGFSTLVASASRGAGGDSGPSRLDMLTSEVMLPAQQVRWRGRVFFKAQHARCAILCMCHFSNPELLSDPEGFEFKLSLKSVSPPSTSMQCSQTPLNSCPCCTGTSRILQLGVAQASIGAQAFNNARLLTAGAPEGKVTKSSLSGNV